jgi:benzoyl-CoA reductase/2-hydroxyglutaryl-CoA dehydratase subunit BcrC/BadD/HgdB
MKDTTTNRSYQRQQRLLKKVHREALEEYAYAAEGLKQRADFHPVWDYFLNLLMRSAHPDTLSEAVGRSIVKHLCNQAPFEIFHAMGLHPLRLSSGCHALGRLSASRLPVLICPMLKATAGMMQCNGHPQPSPPVPLVVPTTCDWVVKFPEMTNGHPQQCCYLELPHWHESEKAQTRWMEEVYDLVGFLEVHTGRKLKRKTLLASVQTFMRAWQAMGKLIAYRRKGALAGVWFTAVANSFMLDPIEPWTENVIKAVEIMAGNGPAPAGNGIFLAGSPIVFPNFKLLDLIEAAGMQVYGDDLCTVERIWPGAVCFEDTSYHGMLRALAERYHRGCICPTFADNDRRINSILNTVEQHTVGGVIYHILKGCHPFDMESFGLEERLKARGYKFLKLETDYVAEDSQNLLTRLEAFGQI